MSEPASEDELTSKTRRRSSKTATGSLKTGSKTKKRKKKSAARSNPDSRLALPAWVVEGRYKKPLGTLGLFLVLPFLCLALTQPQWTGAAGGWMSEQLFLAFGLSTLLFPAWLLVSSARLLGLRISRNLRLRWTPVLFCAVTLLLERASGSGGIFGAWIDRLLCSLVGPAGSWLVAACGTLFGLISLARVSVEEAVETVNRGTVRISEKVRLHLEERQLKLQEEADQDEQLEEDEQSSEATVEPPIWQEMEEPSREVEPQAAPAPPDPPDSEDQFEPSSSLIDEPIMDGLEESCPSDEILHEALSEPSLELESRPALEPGVAEEVEVLASKPVVEEGVLEDPNGQLRLFPGPPKQPAVRYKLPPLTLLDNAPTALRKRPLEDKSQVLLDALDSFGVKAKLLQIVRGPSVTRYELQPARGVKVSRFTSLTNDIALALASTAVRIEAPIPGKSAIGIEIPNDNTDLVVLKDILSSPEFRSSKGLSVALGKDLSGRPQLTNLQKMPHLLVAGTTGSGKSVCVNGLIISLLYRFTPRQLQLMMVDPKQVELSVYEGVPHLVGFAGQEESEIIVDPKRAALALHQVVELMEERYRLFASSRVRNLIEYNEASVDPLPWFVVIIDELADLMMVASKTVETSICRIAQKARAAGIHLVLATQRPSADVITGLIKVNIPSRAAFAVSSQVDSRVILDSSGAEHLLGKGDMLFLPVDASDPKRIQGSFVSNEEIARVVEFWKAQGAPENLIELEVSDSEPDSGSDDDDDSDDALVNEALKVVLQRKAASASMLQTELKVGYARARRILMALEKKGWVGPPEGSKPRKILYTGPVPE